MGWFALMWTNDSGAYIAGRSFGKHKLAPQISPGKTWEGWAGGLLFTVALGWFLQGSMGLEWGLMLAAVVSLLGPLGDLAESFLKRKAGIKDSGHVLPGHGGVLDRFDSHLFSAPVAAVFLLIF
jgi:phosphatidate cytidylyltransferase